MEQHPQGGEGGQLHTSDPNLSLWQSAIGQTIARKYSHGKLAAALIKSDAWLVAVGNHVWRKESGHLDAADISGEFRVLDRVMRDTPEPSKLPSRSWLAGSVHKVVAWFSAWWFGLRHGRAFSDFDFNFVECVRLFVTWNWFRLFSPTYRDCERQGRGDPRYGTIRGHLPARGCVALIGDWGTGLQDSVELLKGLLRARSISAIIHLGDIYYSGTPAETVDHFEAMIHTAMDDVLGVGRRIPVFTIPGNHDYYSGGAGFYGLIDRLNQPPYRQTASYFALQTSDERWQFLGIDTGFHDRGLLTPGSFRAAPAVHESEVRWARGHISRFPGRTILLSHHQRFSACQELNGGQTHHRPNHNESLKELVAGLEDRIAGWFWGHEHCLMIYEELEGISRQRLIGCSAFEMAKIKDPYAIKYSDVKVRDDIRLASSHGWYYHGAATITFPEGIVEYFQFPSWIQSHSRSHRLEQLAFTETLE